MRNVLRTVARFLPVGFLTLGWLSVSPAISATYLVDSIIDALDANLDDGICETSTGDCTLRAAIDQANSSLEHDTIEFAITGTINLGFGFLLINRDVTVVGPGADNLTVSANNSSFRVFKIDGEGNDLTVSVSGLKVTGGNPPLTDNNGAGGGILVVGDTTSLNLDSCIITNNQASVVGGGVANRASTTTINTSTISNNIAMFGGGGIINTGTMTINNSIVSDNEVSSGSGGGIYNDIGEIMLINSSISNNTASDSGGGIVVSGIVDNTSVISIINSTIILNRSTSLDIPGADGIVLLGMNETAMLHNTIISDNIKGNCSRRSIANSAFFSLGSNLSSDRSCDDFLDAPGDRNNIDPRLGPLQDNGGLTQTHALLAGSPAIDTGDESACPSDDQRGIERPQDGDLDGLARCDIGAYERQASPPSESTSCFIATAAFGTPMAQEVRTLCAFRDTYLLTHRPGRVFVSWYYRYSPPVADFLRHKEMLRSAVRLALLPVITVSRFWLEGTVAQKWLATVIFTLFSLGMIVLTSKMLLGDKWKKVSGIPSVPYTPGR
ncbi:CFI-box-CTERM domain-containing protein [Candidatus Entotheonella palauensis]|uniref:CFI-box-CTERM domain-containing protein n=1 Tax=Candidatus Entotheonella palauensis TaxID=93172 RepID=UPI001177D022|nr:CFI-box-CTERM domain-containing protein [Candidatus Entotheonella palauensis]